MFTWPFGHLMVNAEHQTEQEHGNVEDPFAVAILKDGVVVGHVPRELSQTCWYFIGRILCKITGKGKGQLYCKVGWRSLAFTPSGGRINLNQ